MAVFALVLAPWILHAASQPATGQSGAGYKDLAPQDLQALLAREDPFLVDVHVPNEGYLAGTDARIPYAEVTERVGELPSDRDALIVLYCMSGRMSESAAVELARLGYRNVINLAGGMLAWQAAGYELVPE